MKYRIDGPAYVGAPTEWDIIEVKTSLRICTCYTEEAAAMIRDFLEGEG